MSFLCKRSKEAEFELKIQQLESDTAALREDLTNLFSRLAKACASIDEKNSQAMDLMFVQATTETLEDLTGRLEQLELAREESVGRQNQVLKSFGRDLQNLASRLDGHDTRSVASKVTTDKLKSSHEVLRGEVEHRIETLGQILEDTRAVADAARLSQQAEAERCTEELGELQHAAKAQAAQQEELQSWHVTLSQQLLELRQQSLSELKLCMQHQQEEAQRREEHVEEQQAAAVSELHRDMEQLRSWIQDEVAQRVDNAEGTVRYFQDHFVRAQELSESTFHRKVTWMVRSVTPRLRHAVKSQGEVQCFVSPELHFAGQRLVLELQLPAVEDLEAFLAVHGPPPAAPLPGVCAVRIWARPGIRLACLVALGDSAVSGGRAAEHLFPEPGPVSDELGRVPWQIAHVGEFFQSWDRRTDSLTVSLEVLEMRVPPPERPPWPPTNVIEEASPSANGLHPADELSYTNHLAGEALVQERVSADLRRLWSLGTRRMEWTLEGCSRLLQRAQPGHFVESPFFACAGLEGLSLRLYPRGAAVEADSGAAQSSLMLHCEERVSLRGTMSIGSRTKQFEFVADDHGDWSGAQKLGVLERQVDSSDKVLIAVEIAEVDREEDGVPYCVCLRTRSDNPAPALGMRQVSATRRRTPQPFELVSRCVSSPSMSRPATAGRLALPRSAGAAIVARRDGGLGG